MELWEGRYLNGKGPLTVSRTSKRPELVGNALLISPSVVESDALTSFQVIAVETVVDKYRGDEITKDLPNVGEEELVNLDENGFVRQGTVVKCGDILVAKITPKTAEEMTSEEKLVRAIFGAAAAEYRDVSLRWPYRDQGWVIEVKPGDAKEPHNTIRVIVGVNRPLKEGDVLEDEKDNRYVVAGIDPYVRFDALSSRQATLKRGNVRFRKVTACSEEKWQARSTSADVSMLTQMPLGTGLHPGQWIGPAELELLAQAGLKANLKEILTIKSGAILGKVKAYEAVLKGEPVEVEGVAEIAHNVFSLMKGMGFAPTFLDETGQVVELDSGRVAGLQLRLATAEDIRSWSYGEVREPETIEYRTHRPFPNGLYSERIFGPTRDWECHCGKYRKIKYEGVTCDRCGVEVTRSSVRRRRFGHIELPLAVVHFWLIPTIAEKLGLDGELVRKVVYFCADVVVEPEEKAGTIRVGDQEPDPSIKTLFGGEAVKWLLERAGIKPDGFVLEVIPVIPPDLRPIFLENGRWVSHDLSQQYRPLINRVNRLRKIKKLHPPPSIIYHETRLVQETVDALFDNLSRTRPRETSEGRPLGSLAEELWRYLPQLLKRRVEFSGRGIVIPDPKLTPEQIGLPRDFLLELFKPFLMQKLVEREFTTNVKTAKRAVDRDDENAIAALPAVIDRYLLVSGPVWGPMMFLKPSVNNKETVSLHPVTAEKLRITFSGEKVTVHLPLSAAAQEEAATWVTSHGLATPIHIARPESKPVLAGGPREELEKDLVSWAVEGSTRTLTELDRLAIGSE